MLFKSKDSKILLLTIGFLVGALGLVSANAQSQYERSNNNAQRDRVNYITVYEDCNFRGKSRALDIGRYNDVRKLNLRNDSISSVHIPDGLQVILYENENQRGASTILSASVSCLNRQWNDQTSSLEVREDSQSRYSNRDNPRGQNGTRTSRGDNRNHTANIAQIEFSGAAMKLQRRGLWNIVNESGHVSTFNELRRDNNVIFLRSTETNQQVHANIRDRVITFFSRNGQQIDYTIDRTSTKSDTGSRGRNSNQGNRSDSPPVGYVAGRCFNYKAWARGGTGGLKFYDHEGLNRLDDDVKRGKLCHDGTLQVELSKTDLNTEVIFQVEGQTFKFSPNDEPDLLLNTWYRKRVVLKKRR